MNIAIIDEQLLLSQLLATSLEQSLAACQTQVFPNAQALLKHDFSRWPPDLVIIDSILPVIGGLDIIEQIPKRLGHSCPFMVISATMELSLVRQVMQKRVQGYVDTSASVNELVQAISSVMTGKPYIGQSLKESLLAYMLADEPTTIRLSARENEVFQRLCAGLSPKEIADNMDLSLHTVRQYTKLVLRKFKLRRTTELMLYAYKKGLVKPVL